MARDVANPHFGVTGRVPVWGEARGVLRANEGAEVVGLAYDLPQDNALQKKFI
jgi:hypothetical protein